jgi:hypothetical protein
MSTRDIISLIDAEIAKLQQARTLIAPVAESQYTTVAKVEPKKKWTHSPEVRKRIANAQRKRWAKIFAAQMKAGE